MGSFFARKTSSHDCPAVFRGSQQVPQRRTDALFSRLSRPDDPAFSNGSLLGPFNVGTPPPLSLGRLMLRGSQKLSPRSNYYNTDLYDSN